MDKSIVSVNQIAVRSSTCYEFSNSNPAEVVEIEDDPVEVMKTQIEDLKLDDHKSHVPSVFRNLLKEQMDDLEEIVLSFCNEYCTLRIDRIRIRLQKIENYWLMIYKDGEETVKVDDPEKSIIDHLHFVLKNPKIQLSWFEIANHFYKKNASMNLEKIEKLLKSMLESIDHQIDVTDFWMTEFNEDMFLSMLKHVKPGILERITFCFPWRKDGSYEKLKKEIVKTEQWKLEKGIHPLGNLPLKIDDLLHYDEFTLSVKRITPEDVLRVIQHYFNSTGRKTCSLSGDFDIGAIMNAIRSQNDGSEITEIKSPRSPNKSNYSIVKSGKSLFIHGDRFSLEIEKN